MSNTSEKIYYLKDSSLFRIENGSQRAASSDDLLKSKEKYSILIDDKYFFYMGMDNVSVTGKKLNDIASNFLNIMYPGDMVKSFGVVQAKGSTVIFILSDELDKIIDENQALFNGAKRISSPFIELLFRYEDFTFGDGTRFYKKENSVVTFVNHGENYITAKDLLEEITEVKVAFKLPGVMLSSFSKAPFIFPLVFIVLCYILFLIGNIYSVHSLGKVNASYESYINMVYRAAGVASYSDPYGMLIFKSGGTNKIEKIKRVLPILKKLSNLGLEKQGISLGTFTMRDNSVRIDGIAKDFAQVDTIKKMVEDTFTTKVSMDDTKKVDKGVSFIMTFEQQ